MKKFEYANDIHLDFWVPFTNNAQKYEKRTREFANSLVPQSKSEVLVIGGDVGHSNRQNFWFLDELAKQYQKILLVFGNHGFYQISA